MFNKIIAGLLSTTVLTTGILAQDSESYTLEEIVVTAQKRTENLQDVAVSVSAVGAEKMDRVGIQRPSDLAAFVPGLAIVQNVLSNYIYMRGFGSQTNNGFEQSVATFVDGIYHGRGQQSRAPFLDMERIEVLRGPQPIMFGKNAIAGAINMITAKPTDELEGRVMMSYEPKYNTSDLSGYVSGPISDTIRMRVAARKFDTDGWLTNIARDDRREPQRDDLTVRATIDMDVSDTVTASLKFERNEFNALGRSLQVAVDAGVSYLQPDPIIDDKRNVSNAGFPVDRDEPSKNVMNEGVLTVNWDMGGGVLTSITGWSEYLMNEVNDADYATPAILDVVGREDFKQGSQEIRYTSPADEDFSYIIGGYFQKNNLEFDEAADIGVFGGIGAMTDFDQDSTTWSAFVSGTYNMSDALRVTGGLRWGNEKKVAKHRFFGALLSTDANADPFDRPEDAAKSAFLPNLKAVAANLAGTRKESRVSWQIQPQYDINENTMLYASIATAYKGGGFDARTQSLAFEFEDEKSLAFEFGAKNTLLDGAAELNVALFHTKYDNLQQSLFNGVIGYDVLNAAEATSKGVELDGRWRASEGLYFTGSFSYVDFSYDKFPNGSCATEHKVNPDAFSHVSIVDGVCYQDLKGKTNIYAPKITSSFGVEYTTMATDNLEIRFNVDANTSSSFFMAGTLAPQSLQSKFAKINARIQLTDVDADWSLALYGDNITNKITSSYKNTVPLTGGLAYQAMTQEPRVFGIQASFNF